jgi:hypothetical protein
MALFPNASKLPNKVVTCSISLFFTLQEEVIAEGLEFLDYAGRDLSIRHGRQVHSVCKQGNGFSLVGYRSLRGSLVGVGEGSLLRTSRSIQGTGVWYIGGVLHDIRYRGDSDVKVLVVREPESEWVVTGAAVATASTGGCVCDLSCTGRTYAFLSTRPILTRQGGSASPLGPNWNSTRDEGPSRTNARRTSYNTCVRVSIL